MTTLQDPLEVSLEPPREAPPKPEAPSTLLLRKIAHVIRSTPSQWDQGNYIAGHRHDPTSRDLDEIRRAHHSWTTQVDCGKGACVAGWAVRLAPNLIVDDDEGWTQVGARLLDLDMNLAEWVFDEATARGDHEVMAGMLEHLASLNPRERNGDQIDNLAKMEAGI